MRRIVLIPLSGYANRLQSIASASILAHQLGASLEVCWLPDEVAPVAMDRVLSTDFCAQHAISPGQVYEETGIDPGRVPLHLNRKGPVITLAGHLRGEQAFMADLAKLLDDDVTTIIIRAGGRFYLPGPGVSESSFARMRSVFYQSRILRAEIEDDARLRAERHHPYLGLHLRYTDRAHQAPFTRSIAAALRSAAAASGLTEILIAGDTAAARNQWTERAQALGLHPWSFDQQSWDRSEQGSEFPALVDWRLLSLARQSIYFAESTFAVEAAVASGDFDSTYALPEHPVRSIGVRLAALGRSAITYPNRHWR